MSWWQNAAVYQVYPRSFQDSDGDGVGDLSGIASRLDHLVRLGVDALWLSPIYPSPMADFGYDVSDYTAIDPVFGTLEQFDALLDAVHERGLKLLMDLVPSHTSIEHRWFREHPDWYIWADQPNNWLSAFGGSAWTYHEGQGRYYLHSFYPEQPDLDWRNPEVKQAMGDVIRFWVARGVDGFRIDAIDRIMKDASLRDELPWDGEPFGLRLSPEEEKFTIRYSRNDPDVGEALSVLREAAGDAFLVGEVYLPSARAAPYLEYFDACFVFELYQAPWEAQALRRAIEGALALDRPAWVLSNHDFSRLATRFGREKVPAAATLLLTLPGLAFVYQGDELGMGDGPGANPPRDRAGRDPYRHPMQWTREGGFTSGEPWLPYVDPAERNVEDGGELLELFTQLIALRPKLGKDLHFVDSEPGVLAYRRGDFVIEINTTAEPRGGLDPHAAHVRPRPA